MGSLLEWSKDLEFGVAATDSDHKQLVTLANELNDAMKNAEGQEIVGSKLRALAHFAAGHFVMEEKVMQSYGYEGFETHAGEHYKLRNELAQVLARHDLGSISVNIKLLDFIKDWLVNHIKGADKQFCAFLSAKGLK